MIKNAKKLQKIAKNRKKCLKMLENAKKIIEKHREILRLAGIFARGGVRFFFIFYFYFFSN
jgi:hypothetical protein